MSGQLRGTVPWTWPIETRPAGPDYLSRVIVAMHVATGAAAGAAVGSRGEAAVLGLVLHALGDAVPHRDFESLRFEAATGLGLLALLALRRGVTDPAVIGGALSAAPDLEHVVPHPGHDGPKLFPSHRIESWHREGGISAPLQLLLSVVIVALLVLRRKEKRRCR